MWCKGKVEGGLVVLEEGTALPDGTEVMVLAPSFDTSPGRDILPEDLAQRRRLAAQMHAFGQRLAGRQVRLSDAVLEGREELDARA